MKHFILFFFVLLPFCIFSQVQDSFDGPEINSRWTGEKRDSFAITPDGRLQPNVKGGVDGSASIGTLIPYKADMQWEFDVKMAYPPSNNNRLLVYLYLEKGLTNFFYLRIGFDGSLKLALCSKDGKPMFKQKINNYQKDSWVHFKVTLEGNEHWTVYSRQHAVSYYVNEGSCSYPVLPAEEGKFSFQFHYTATRSKLFSVDNVQILHEITPTATEPADPPTEPMPDPEEVPELIEVEPITMSSVRFTFDRAVDIRQATFSISGIGDAYTARHIDNSEQKKVVASFEEEMESGNRYTVSYRGIKSETGAAVPDYSKTFTLDEEGGDDTDHITKGAVRINEIMADPKGLLLLPETEYVELYNVSGKAISLSGWQFVYGGSGKTIGNITLPVGGYAVLYRSGREIGAVASAVKIPMDNFPASLANTGKNIQLLDLFGNIIDDVTYAKATPAKSWERSASGNWFLSTDPKGGTPGAVNSGQSGTEPEEPVEPEEPEEPDDPELPVIPEGTTILPGEIIFNELLPEPYLGGAEYIELYNRSDRDLSLSGLSLATRKTDNSLSTRYPLAAASKILRAKEYVLLTKRLYGVDSLYRIPASSIRYEIPKLPILANTSSTLVLFRTKDEVIIDEVAYSSKWHATSVKNYKGVALERIDPDGETQDPANWISATLAAGFGTPGYENSQYKKNAPGGSTGIEVPVWEDESSVYNIAYLLDKPGYNCRAFVFNLSGVRVAEIANHELLGTAGQLTWNGSSSNGTRLSAGVYIFYAEIYHPDGVVKRFKRAFLVR